MVDEWRILHCADLHLDTPFKGLRSQDEALGERLERASFDALERILDQAVHQEVDALLIAGDTFDSQDPGLRARFAFRDALDKLREHGVRVFIAAGNHDPLPSWGEELAAKDHVKLFSGSSPERELLRKEALPPLEIVGMSLPQAVVKENLARSFPEADRESLSIALMHGTFGASGSHHPYNPFRTEDVEQKGYDMWALGHIHQRGTPSAQAPLIHYPGVPQGRHPNEEGAKGVSLLRSNGRGVPTIEFLPTHSVRFERMDIDISSLSGFEELEQHLERTLSDEAASESLILRIRMTGRTSLHHDLQDPSRIEALREYITRAPKGDRAFRWIDRLEDRTWPDRAPEELRERGDLVGELYRSFEDLLQEPSALEGTFQELQKEYGASHLRMEDKELNEEEKKELIERALWKLLDEFLKEEEEGQG